MEPETDGTTGRFSGRQRSGTVYDIWVAFESQQQTSISDTAQPCFGLLVPGGHGSVLHEKTEVGVPTGTICLTAMDDTGGGVTDLSTRPKKESQERRVIMDLSWPHNGASMNDGISKEKYVEQTIQLQYPTVDCLCQRAAELRTSGVMGYKIDMDRALNRSLWT